MNLVEQYAFHSEMNLHDVHRYEENGVYYQVGRNMRGQWFWRKLTEEDQPDQDLQECDPEVS